MSSLTAFCLICVAVTALLGVLKAAAHGGAMGAKVGLAVYYGTGGLMAGVIIGGALGL